MKLIDNRIRNLGMICHGLAEVSSCKSCPSDIKCHCVTCITGTAFDPKCVFSIDSYNLIAVTNEVYKRVKKNEAC